MKGEDLETYQEVGKRFGVPDRRVAQFVKELGLEPHRDVLDKRRKLLGPEQVKVIAQRLRVNADEDVRQMSQGSESLQFTQMSARLVELERRVQGLSEALTSLQQGVYDTIASINQTNAVLAQRLIVVEQQAQSFAPPADAVGVGGRQR